MPDRTPHRPTCPVPSGGEPARRPRPSHLLPRRVRLGVTLTVTAALLFACAASVVGVVRRPHAEKPTVSETPSRPATITVAAVGDMMFTRRMTPYLAEHGYDAVFAGVEDVLRIADVTVGNLETPLAATGTPVPDKGYVFRSDPRVVGSLTRAGFDLLALGNNHAGDMGPAGVLSTLAALDASGLAHAGAGANAREATAPAIVARGGARVALLSFTQIVPPGFAASAERAGVADGRRIGDLTAAVRAARKRADYVIVSMHWGDEYKYERSAEQLADAHALVDAGADMVLAHHPHVIQGVEFYRGRLIAYSLGDFAFDHASRETGESFILRASLGPGGITGVEAVPVYLTDPWGVPELTTGAEASLILKRLKKYSPPSTVLTAEGGIGTLVSR